MLAKLANSTALDPTFKEFGVVSMLVSGSHW
jgi:hypothetical protein